MIFYKKIWRLMTNSEIPIKQPNWNEIISSPDFIRRIDITAEKRFMHEPLMQEMKKEMMALIGDDNCLNIVAAYEGKSRPETLAYAYAFNGLLYSVNWIYRWDEPPRWLKEQDQPILWVMLWRMLCFEKQPSELIQKHLAGDYQEGVIDNIISTIKKKIPNCGEASYLTQIYKSMESKKYKDWGDEESLDNEKHAFFHQQAMALISKMLIKANKNNVCVNGIDGTRVNETLTLLNKRVKLTADDRLLLSLYYEDAFSNEYIAYLLGVNVATVRQKLQTIYSQLSLATQMLDLTNVIDSGAVANINQWQKVILKALLKNESSADSIHDLMLRDLSLQFYGPSPLIAAYIDNKLNKDDTHIVKSTFATSFILRQQWCYTLNAVKLV